MKPPGPKQPTLKPQDLLVVLKLAIDRYAPRSYAALAEALAMSASEVHAAVARAIGCHLVEREGGELVVNRAALQDFVVHGLRFVFPAVTGPVTRGMPTGAAAPILRGRFGEVDALPMVWPDPEGEVRGVSLLPLYPTVPQASRNDPRLHDALALVDALRAGAAREREMARELFKEMIA